MSDAAPAPRYVPRLAVGQTPERRSEYKDEVAARIKDHLLVHGSEYERFGGLNRLISRVASESGWSRADVYNALLEVPGVEFDLAQQTIRRAPSPGAAGD